MVFSEDTNSKIVEVVKRYAIDETCLASEYLWTEGNPIQATKNIIQSLKETLTRQEIKPVVYGIGTTGSARNLIASILGENVVKNEITAHAIGTLSVFPDVRII